jgi:hypothetical protein
MAPRMADAAKTSDALHILVASVEDFRKYRPGGSDLTNSPVFVPSIEATHAQVGETILDVISLRARCHSFV